MSSPLTSKPMTTSWVTCGQPRPRLAQTIASTPMARPAPPMHSTQIYHSTASQLQAQVHPRPWPAHNQVMANPAQPYPTHGRHKPDHGLFMAIRPSQYPAQNMAAPPMTRPHETLASLYHPMASSWQTHPRI
jgi:hypothetical protein